MADVMQRQKEAREQSLKTQEAQTESKQIIDQVKQRDFEANNVKLSSGEWITKAEYQALSAEDQALIMKLGIQGFNDYYKQQEADFKANNVQVKDGFISKDAYNALSAEDQQRINTLGIKGFNEYYEKQQQEFERNNVKLNTGEYISKTEYDSLAPAWQSEISARGIDGFQDWLKEAYPGAKGYTVIDDPNGKIVYGTTDDPNIGIDAGGNRIWIGGRWPENVKAYLQGVEIRGSQIISKEQLEAEKLAATAKVSGAEIAEPKTAISTIKTAGELTDTIQLSDGQYIDRTAFDLLDEKYKDILKEKGIKEFQKEYALDHVKLPDGTYLTNSTWAHLSKDDQMLAEEKGYEAVIKKNTIELKSGEFVDKEQFNSLPPKMQEVAMTSGLEAINLSNLSPEDQFKRMQEWDMIPKDAKYGGIDDSGQILIKGEDVPWQEKYLNAEMAKGVAVGMIPIAGTVYHWEKMQPWERGLSIVLDVATFIPFVGAVSAGVRGGTKLTAAIGRAALAEVKAPITMIAHPIDTAKSMLYSIETMLRPSKVPLTALEIRSSTVRLPVDDIGKATDAMEARDIVTKAAIMGDKPSVEIAGKQIELSKVALQQKTSPAAIHATPDVRPFLAGTEIQAGREGGLFVAPSLHSRFTGASAFGDMPEGGIPGAVIIRDEEALAKLQPSGKIYRNTAEIEQVVGAGAKLPPPSQVLMTRDISGNKLTLLIIGKPLSKTEIARLKFVGSADLVKDIFRPAAKISGKGIDEMAELGKEARTLEKELAAAKKANNATDIKRLETEIKVIDQRGRNLSRAADLRYAAKSSLRPIGISTADFTDRISYNDLARSRPAEFARTMNSLPDAERTRILDDLDRTNRTKIEKEMGRVSRQPEAERETGQLRAVEPERIIMDTSKIEPERGAVREETPKTGGLPERGNVPTKTDIPSTVKTVPPDKIENIITHIESKSEDKKKLTAKQLEGAIAWKQGFIYHLHYPPFGADDVFYSREPIPGVKYHEGIGSAAKSAVTLYGEIPQNIRLDMGIVDIDIQRAEKTGQPQLGFKADPKQKTKQSGIVKDKSSIKISK